MDVQATRELALGPDLTGIRSTRSGGDLLESTVFPSTTIVRGYEPYTVVTTDGLTLEKYAALLRPSCIRCPLLSPAWVPDTLRPRQAPRVPGRRA